MYLGTRKYCRQVLLQLPKNQNLSRKFSSITYNSEMVTPFSGIAFHENFRICAKLERMYVVCNCYYTCIIFLNLVAIMCKLYNLEIALFTTPLLNSLAKKFFFFLSTHRLISTSRRDMLMSIPPE